MINYIIVFVFGSIIGSFLNVCIYRMPLEKSVVSPRSYCPQCKKTIPWYDNIPMLSYIILLGRCRSCKARIPFRYFLVELFTAGLFLVLFKLYNFSLDFFIYAIFVSGLIVATFVDIQHRIIPDEISVGGIVVGLLLGAVKGLHFNPLAYGFRPLVQSLLGIIVGGGIIYLTGAIFNFFYFDVFKKPLIDGEKEAMGGGDVKLLAMIGAFLGWKAAILTFFLAPFFGAVIGIAHLLIKKDHTIPYGPFLSLAALISFFWLDTIINFLFFR